MYLISEESFQPWKKMVSLILGQNANTSTKLANKKYCLQCDKDCQVNLWYAKCRSFQVLLWSLAAQAAYNVLPVCVRNKQSGVEGELPSKQSTLQLIKNISCSVCIFYLECSLESFIFLVQFLCLLSSFSGPTFQRESIEGEIRGYDSEFSESSPWRNLAEERISPWDAKFSGPGPDANFECMAHITLFLD